MTRWVSLPTVSVDKPIWISLIVRICTSLFFIHFFQTNCSGPHVSSSCLALIDAYALSGTESSLSLTYSSLLAYCIITDSSCSMAPSALWVLAVVFRMGHIIPLALGGPISWPVSFFVFRQSRIRFAARRRKPPKKRCLLLLLLSPTRMDCIQLWPSNDN